MSELDELTTLIERLEKQKKKMTGQQYMDMMVAIKGLHAKWDLDHPEHQPRKKGEFRPCKPGELKVGDKVRVTTMDDPDEVDDMKCGWGDSMNAFKGKTSVVTNVKSSDYGNVQLKISGYYFSPRWLEKV